MTRCLPLVVLVLAVGCTKRADYCQSDSDCTDPAFPFCDVDGQYGPSGGVHNVCTIVPPDCPVSVCGCTPNVTTCIMGALQTCDASGSSATTVPCALGCGSGGATCASFTPSNNLASALASAASAASVEIPAGAVVDTDAGTITGTMVDSTIVMVQAIAIRVFAAPSWTLPSIQIRGDKPVAFVASGKITVNDTLDASAGLTNGFAPGAGLADESCAGQSLEVAMCGSAYCGPGAGGGGGGTQGGNGGEYMSGAAGGGAIATGFAPLVGGCSGGGESGLGAPATGGGGVQLVSATEVDLDALVDVSGAGAVGVGGGGGGAGGMVVIESPTISISATGGIRAIGGGGGGGCGTDGTDGSAGAAGGTCTDATQNGGKGGNGASIASSGGNGTAGDNANVLYGGGGGAVGRARLASKDGTASQQAGATMSVAVTSDTLVPN
jgi:hypothetical protein